VSHYPSMSTQNSKQAPARPLTLSPTKRRMQSRQRNQQARHSTQYVVGAVNVQFLTLSLLTVFQPYPGGVPRAPPLTAREKKKVQIYREMIAEKHASPAYTGPPGSLKALCNKRTAADFNVFEDQQTYNKKYEKKPFRLADPKKRKWQAPHLFPKELWEHIGYNPDASEDEQAPRKKIVLNKTLDKLARFDDDAETGGKDDDADEEVNADEDADPDVEAPRDDDFSEDEDDDGNDYNAEQYFDDGEDDHEEAGDEGGGGEDW